jgi:hypothetical protein
MSGTPFDLQLLNACAALLLLVSFAMLSQRRIVTLVEYWPEPFAPPEHRRHLAEPLG